MRIVVNDYLGRAPQVQLSRALATRGHSVLHLYSSDVQSPKADLERRPDDPSGFAVEGLGHGRPPATSFIGQRWQEARFGRLVARRATSFNPDVVIACNNPLDAQRKVQAACRRARIPFVYWLQEFHSVRMDRRNGRRAALHNVLIGGYYHWLERRLLYDSDALVPIADDLVAILAENWDVYERQCMVVHNWAPLDGIPVGPKVNPWSRAQGIADRRVALYTGSLGPFENPPLLAALAQRLAAAGDDALVLVLSEGDGAQWLAREARERSIDNLRVLPFQPYEMYGDVLASADVLLGMVDADAGLLFVPSKVMSYLCAARPVVLSAPWRNLAAQTIRESSGGCVTSPGDPDAMAEAVRRYLNDERLRAEIGRRARAYAERRFEIDQIAARFERLFERLHTGPPRRRSPGPTSTVVTGLR